MHKVYFNIGYIEQWYEIINELRKWFGTEWKGQRGVRKKFHVSRWSFDSQTVWFIIPDLSFKTFMDLKMSNNPKLK
jgi:hypothetical protein